MDRRELLTSAFKRSPEAFEKGVTLGFGAIIATNVMPMKDVGKAAETIGKIQNTMETVEQFTHPLAGPVANMQMTRRGFMGRSALHSLRTVEQHVSRAKHDTRKAKAFRTAKKIVEL